MYLPKLVQPHSCLMCSHGFGVGIKCISNQMRQGYGGDAWGTHSTSNPQHTQCSQYMPGEKVKWPGFLTTINLRCVQFLISLVSGISMALWKA